MTLSFEQRQKSRLRCRLDNGEEIALVLPRGTVLRGGDRLRAEDGRIVQVRAAAEPVSTANSANPQRLSRVAYHLGNRHVNLQIGDTWVRYLQDHVLDEMVEALGLTVVRENKPFEPEAGAYHTHQSHGEESHAHSH